MKAKEYAEEFMKNVPFTNDIELRTYLTKLMIDFMKEGQEIAKARSSNPDSCLIAVIKEQIQKYKVFTRIVNEEVGVDVLKSSGFKEWLIFKIPEFKGKI